jgi:gas vesicle protein
MAQNNNNMVKGLIVGFLAGSAIGAVLALLYAPKSGKELRADLKEKADDLLEGADEYVQAARTKATAMVSEAKKRSELLISDAQQKAQSLLQDADKVLSGAKQKLPAMMEEGARLKDAVKAGVDAYKEERNRS